MNYCEKCKKIVPDSEVKEFTIFNKKSKLHFTSKMVNFYTQGGRYQAPGKIGFDPVTETRYCGSVKEVEEMARKSKKVETETEVEVLTTSKSTKPYAEEAHEFLKILGKWVELKKTFPSGYVEYHEATRKFLEDFKNKK